jgi:hypothetical protein
MEGYSDELAVRIMHFADLFYQKLIVMFLVPKQRTYKGVNAEQYKCERATDSFTMYIGLKSTFTEKSNMQHCNRLLTS